MTKRAVLVGLNAYADPRNRLRGCLNDVRQVGWLLEQHFGFDTAALRVLTDAGATSAAIRSALQWLVTGARAGDVLVFHYSGHGSQVPDRQGDETTDRLDEILCPYDLDWDDPLSDDDLQAIFADLPLGANLTVILDCCHSGTGLRKFRARCFETGETGDSAPRARCLCPPPDLAPSPSRAAEAQRRLRRLGRRAVEAGAILISACRDDQVSADAFINGDYHGALTFYLCQALAESRFSTTYRDLVRAVRRLLATNGYEQEPQLEAPAALAQSQAFSALLQPARVGVARRSSSTDRAMAPPSGE